MPQKSYVADAVQTVAYLGSCQPYTTVFFWEKRQQLLADYYICKNLYHRCLKSHGTETWKKIVLNFLSLVRLFFALLLFGIISIQKLCKLLNGDKKVSAKCSSWRNLRILNLCSNSFQFLTHWMLLVSFCRPWKHLKTRFQMFSRKLEKIKCHKID